MFAVLMAQTKMAYAIRGQAGCNQPTGPSRVALVLKALLCNAVQTLQVSLLIGCGTVALCLPQGLAEAFHHVVFRVMDAHACHEASAYRGDTRRPVSVRLFAQGDVHAHVQKRIAVA